METLGNHFVELVAPFLLLAPWRRARIIGGAIQILFQATIILSGNLSFLNWLTMLPAIFCFDDLSLAWLFGRRARHEAAAAATLRARALWKYTRTLVNFALGSLILYLSVPVIQNLLAVGGQQSMNASFGAFKLVNTYGAFGSITKTRTEVVFEGTMAPNPSDPNAEWLEYALIAF
jgi:hypothetical protein